MKWKLIKTGNDYILRDLSGEVLGITIGEINGKLSLKNCQAVERGYDLDAIIENNTNEYITTNIRKFNYGFEKGFQKALEILGDRRFTENDVIRAMQDYSLLDISEDKIIQSLQQNEWEVEIEMEEVNIGDKYTPDPKPKLDADGCLILKRVI